MSESNHARVHSHPSQSTKTKSACWSSGSQNLRTRIKPLGHDKASAIPGDLELKGE